MLTRRIVLAAAAATPLAGFRPVPVAPRPLPDTAAPLARIAFGSCLDQERPMPILSALTGLRPDLLLMMGDNVYGSAPSQTLTPDLDVLRAAYGGLAARRDFARLREAVPIWAVWDDHDFGINDAGADHPFAAEAQALFCDFWGEDDTSVRRSREGLHDARIFGPPGRRVQVILLDTRRFRSPLVRLENPEPPALGRYVPTDDPAASVLGEAQWAWLDGELRKPAELRFLISSIQVLAEGHRWERWGNFPRERERLFAAIRAADARGLVLVTGDRHIGAFYRAEIGGGRVLHEATSSGMNRAWAEADEPGPNRLGDLVRVDNAGLAEIDWAGASLRLSLRDAAGAPVRTLDLAFADLN